MIQSRRISALLKIQPGEERLVGSLVSLYFVLALSYVFVQSMAFGLFITEYGPDFLPYSYLTLAVFATLVAFIYLKLSDRLPFSRLVTLNLVFLASGSFLIWTGLRSPLSHYFAFLLPLWFQVLLNLGNLAIWPLAGRLLDIQQGKRLFGLVGAGMWLANIIGGLLVPLIVSRVGTVNLLLLAVLSLLAALFLLRRLLRKFQQRPASAYPETLNRAIQKSDRWAGNSYVLLIFGYTFIWWVSFYFIDNIFYNRLAAQYPDLDQLTAFMGAFLSFMGIIAFITTTFLTSRIIGRFGLRTGLLTMPLLVTLGTGLLALAGSLAAPALLVFGLSVSVKLINVALGFSLSQSANVIVYQSLSERIRSRVQTTAEGIVQPLAIGSAGLFLLALTTLLSFGYIGLSYVFLGLGVLWLSSILYLSRGYVPALLHTITRRRLGESRTALTDPAMLSILRAHLDDPQPAAVLYSIARLEEIDPQLLVEALPRLVTHPSADVRRLAYTRIEYLSLQSALEALLHQLDVESDTQARQAGLQALAAISGSPVPEMLTSALHSGDPPAVRGALVGLLKYQSSPAAQAELDLLLESPLEPQRLLAAQVLEQLHQPGLDDAYTLLLADPSPAVRRAALASAAASPHPNLVDEFLAACASPHTSRLAATALASIGQPALPAIQDAFSQPDSSPLRSMALARSLGEIGGERAAALLLTRLDTPDGDLRTQVLTSLSQCGYRTTDQAEIKRQVESEIRWVVWICAFLAQPGFQDANLLSAALNQAFQHSLRRVLLLLSFLLDSPSILRAMDVFTSRAKFQSGYALEIVLEQLPAGWNRFILPLLEDHSPQERLSRLAPLFPPPGPTLEEGLQILIAGTPTMQSSPWLRSCAIYTAARLPSLCHSERPALARSLSWRQPGPGSEESLPSLSHSERSEESLPSLSHSERSEESLPSLACLDAIKSTASDPHPLVASTASWALSQLEPGGKQGNIPMLSTVEKVLILKTVGMFSQTPDDVLADVADLLVEVDANPGDRLIAQGEQGDSLFVIVDGKVRVHDGERLLSYLGERQVFGEMALLDPEPRMASVTAVEPSRLFRLDQVAFYQLIAERPEVSIGIIHVLTARLRSLTRDTAPALSSASGNG